MTTLHQGDPHQPPPAFLFELHERAHLELWPLIGGGDVGKITNENLGSRTRKRRPSLASVARQAERAGIPVAGYEIRPDGTIKIITGKPDDEKPDPNEWDGVLLQ